MATLGFFVAWFIVVIYVIVGNYFYFNKVLPALAKDGLDASIKLMPSAQFAQIDLYLSRFPPGTTRPWFCGFLAHIRTISVVVVLIWLAGCCALAFSP